MKRKLNGDQPYTNRCGRAPQVLPTPATDCLELRVLTSFWPTEGLPADRPACLLLEKHMTSFHREVDVPLPSTESWDWAAAPSG